MFGHGAHLPATLDDASVKDTNTRSSFRVRHHASRNTSHQAPGPCYAYVDHLRASLRYGYLAVPHRSRNAKMNSFQIIHLRTSSDHG